MAAARRTRAVAAGTEWVGGIVPMPAYVTGRGRAVPSPDPPDDPGGPVLGTTMGEGRGRAARDGLGAPPFGDRIADGSGRAASGARTSGFTRARGRPPKRGFGARVSSARPRRSSTTWPPRCAGTWMTAPRRRPYLDLDVGPDAVGAFFRAAAALIGEAVEGRPRRHEHPLAHDREARNTRRGRLGDRPDGREPRRHRVPQHQRFRSFPRRRGRHRTWTDADDAAAVLANFERGADMTSALRKEMRCIGGRSQDPGVSLARRGRRGCNRAAADGQGGGARRGARARARPSGRGKRLSRRPSRGASP